ncbi:MAG: hypothetical protein ABI222_05450 [Opitutaceae bacterium]
MATLSVTKANTKFRGVVRRVIKTKQPVLVRTPQGFTQILSDELVEAVPPAARGALKLTRRELALHNTFG